MNPIAKAAIATGLIVSVGGILLTLAGASAARRRMGDFHLLSAHQSESTRIQGRAVVDLIRKKENTTLFHKFTPQMAQAVPESTLRQVTDSLTQQGSIGERLGESVREMGKTRVYAAEHRWTGDQNLRITMTFEGDQISSLLAKPAKPLPTDPYAGYKTKTNLRLPFEAGQEWYIFWGGDTELENYHVIAPDQRHAYDIVSRLPGGSTHKGDGKQNEDYVVWGRTILAPAAAMVVEAVDGVHDNTPQVEMNRKEIAGNHILLDFGNGEYGLLAHFQKGSVLVKAGDKVKAGQPLGKCGNSGNTSEPHLHFHLQDKPVLFNGARGLPVVFTDYVSDGKQLTSGTPVQGETIKAK